MRYLCWMLLGITNLFTLQAADTLRPPLSVIAYYSGNASEIDRYNVQSLTHIIYSFALMKNNRLHVSAAAGNILRKLVFLKKKNPRLKVALAFGGWGGCPTCSNVFKVAANRDVFAQSVLAVLLQYQLDGIDIDWEFPTLESLPGHGYDPDDKQTFTELIKAVRRALGIRYELSFAAGVFPEYLYNAVEWKKVMPLVNRVHLMSYDMVNRKSTFTGHHSALYSTACQTTSIDNAIRFLDSLQTERSKIVIGAAFYARMYKVISIANNGLYQPAVFDGFTVYKNYAHRFTAANGFTCYWDDTAKAPYCFNATKKLFATFDDERSIVIKTGYAIDKKLNGLLIWELRQDDAQQRLLQAIGHCYKNYTSMFVTVYSNNVALSNK